VATSAAAARPIAPLTGSHVATHRPTLRWALTSEATGAHVTLCRDRALTRGCVSFDATGTMGTPSSDLAGGVWGWGVRALARGAIGAPSAVWRLRLAQAPATTSSHAWGADPDLDGDGFADVIAAVQNVALYTYAGGSSGTSTTATTFAAPLDSTN